MKRFILAAILLIVPVQAFAQFIDGNKLHEKCNDTLVNVFVTGYVLAVHDTTTILRYNAPKMNICTPPTVNAGQLRDIVCYKLASNPQERHQYGSFLVWKYLNEAFPCQSK